MPRDESAAELNHPHVADASLRRVLGPWSAAWIVIGAVIGVGIFFSPGSVARIAGSGPMALAAWAIGAVIAMLGALTFAELGGLCTRSAGQYEIIRDAYGPMPGFLFVFCNATAILPGSAAVIAIVCAQNVAVAIAVDPSPQALAVMASLLVIGVATANAIGVRYGAAIQAVTGFTRVATLVAVTLLAVCLRSPPSEPNLVTQSGAGPFGLVATLFAALVPAFFSYGGWQQILWIGGEIRDPQRNVPRATIIGMLVVAAVYVLVNWAYIRLIGFEGVSKSSALAADAVTAAWPHYGRRAVSIAVALSAFGVLNSQLLTGPRLVYGMAEDGRFFKMFASISARFRTPIASIVLIAAMALILLNAAGRDAVNMLVTGVVSIDAIFFIFTAGAFFILRRTKPNVPRFVRTPAALAFLFLLCEVGILAGSFFDESVRHAAVFGAVWVLLAAICYGIFFRGESTLDQITS